MHRVIISSLEVKLHNEKGNVQFTLCLSLSLTLCIPICRSAYVELVTSHFIFTPFYIIFLWCNTIFSRKNHVVVVIVIVAVTSNNDNDSGVSSRDSGSNDTKSSTHIHITHIHKLIQNEQAFWKSTQNVAWRRFLEFELVVRCICMFLFAKTIESDACVCKYSLKYTLLLLLLFCNHLLVCSFEPS